MIKAVTEIPEELIMIRLLLPRGIGNSEIVTYQPRNPSTVDIAFLMH